MSIINFFIEYYFFRRELKQLYSNPTFFFSPETNKIQTLLTPASDPILPVLLFETTPYTHTYLCLNAINATVYTQQ